MKKFAEMTQLRLNGGPSDGVVLDLAPTMRNVHHHGERYFRMDRSRAIFEDGSEGGSYLWEHYWDDRLKKADA